MLINQLLFDMIKLSRLADYGMILMVQLARMPDRRVNATELADQTGLPLPTVSKLTKQLAASDLLLSHRGAAGGYVLGRPAEQISVAQIVAALDGPIALTECMSADGAMCEIEALCPTRTNWRQINNALVSALENVSLSDMAEEPGAQIRQAANTESGRAPAAGSSANRPPVM